jgi:hypothetical protein
MQCIAYGNKSPTRLCKKNRSFKYIFVRYDKKTGLKKVKLLSTAKLGHNEHVVNEQKFLHILVLHKLSQTLFTSPRGFVYNRVQLYRLKFMYNFLFETELVFM